MIINDPENLIPDHFHLRRLIHRHPLDADLGTRIAKVTILRSERCGIAQESINIDANGNVSLGVGEATCHKQDYDTLDALNLKPSDVCNVRVNWTVFA